MPTPNRKGRVSKSASSKRRLHQSPTAKEIDVCRWWLDSERALVQPQLVLALGASAARGVLGKTISVQKERGKPQLLGNASCGSPPTLRTCCAAGRCARARNSASPPISRAWRQGWAS